MHAVRVQRFYWYSGQCPDEHSKILEAAMSCVNQTMLPSVYHRQFVNPNYADHLDKTKMVPVETQRLTRIVGKRAIRPHLSRVKVILQNYAIRDCLKIALDNFIKIRKMQFVSYPRRRTAHGFVTDLMETATIACKVCLIALTLEWNGRHIPMGMIWTRASGTGAHVLEMRGIFATPLYTAFRAIVGTNTTPSLSGAIIPHVMQVAREWKTPLVGVRPNEQMESILKAKHGFQAKMGGFGATDKLKARVGDHVGLEHCYYDGSFNLGKAVHLVKHERSLLRRLRRSIEELAKKTFTFDEQEQLPYQEWYHNYGKRGLKLSDFLPELTDKEMQLKRRAMLLLDTAALIKMVNNADWFAGNPHSVPPHGVEEKRMATRLWLLFNRMQKHQSIAQRFLLPEKGARFLARWLQSF